MLIFALNKKIDIMENLAITQLEKALLNKDNSKWEIPTNDLSQAIKSLPFTEEECLLLIDKKVLINSVVNKGGLVFITFKYSLRGLKQFLKSQNN